MGNILLQRGSTRRYFGDDGTIVYLDCGSDYMVIHLTYNHCRTILRKVNFTVYVFFFFNLEGINITLNVLLLMNLSFR